MFYLLLSYNESYFIFQRDLRFRQGALKRSVVSSTRALKQRRIKTKTEETIWGCMVK